MLFHPFAPLLALMLGIISFGLIGGGAYLIWEYVRGLAAISALWWGVGMLAFSAFGRFLVLAAFGRRGQDDPAPERSADSHIIERPDGARLHVEYFGPPDAPMILLTHGFSQDSTTWYYVKRLSARYRVITWDLRGLGYSKRPRSKDYSMEAMAEDLHAIVNHVTPGPPLLLVGHSMGGMIALTLLRTAGKHFHQRISGLALVNTTHTNPVKTCAFRRLTTALQRPVLTPLLRISARLWPMVWLQNWTSYNNGLSHLMTRIFTFAGNQTCGQLEYATKLSAKCHPGVLSRQMLCMFRYDATSTLPRIDIPTLIVTAPKDIATLPDASHTLQQSLRNAELVTVEGAAHASLQEQGEAVRQALEEFADKVLQPAQEMHRAA